MADWKWGSEMDPKHSKKLHDKFHLDVCTLVKTNKQMHWSGGHDCFPPQEDNVILLLSFRSGSVDSEPLLSPADSSTPASHRGSTEVGGQSEWDEMFHKQTAPS